MVKVVGYVRVSTEEQAEGGVSLDAQRDKIEAYAKLYDCELVEVIEDAGVSAKTLQRPGLRKALRLLRLKSADGLLIAKLDRLTRNVADLAKLITDYFGERPGKVLLSASDQIDTRSAGGRLLLNVLTTVAQWEREVIAERTRDALRHKKAQGIALGQVPLGFERTADGRLIAAPAELEVLERVRTLHQEGLSLRQVAARLTAEGRQTKRGRAWHPTTLARLLSRR